MGSEACQVACPISSSLNPSDSNSSDCSSSKGLIPRFMNDLFKGIEAAEEASRLSNDVTTSASRASGGEGDASAVTSAGSSDIGESAETTCAKPDDPVCKYKVTASFLEVYGEDIHDLLALNHNNPSSLPIREDASGVTVVGLSSKVINSAEEAIGVLQKGTMHRTTAETLMNKHSSRSHAVFTVTLTKEISLPGAGPDQDDSAAQQLQMNRTTISKLTFVDLAGSERMKKTGAEGERMKEGIQINVGLLALGNVINALGGSQSSANAGVEIEGSAPRHVPYRQSKLTRLLQDALGGNSRTVFLACVSPLESDIGESLSTLKYANRAKNIKNKPIKNVDPTILELGRLEAIRRGLKVELLRLKFFELKGEQPPESLFGDGAQREDFFKRDEVAAYLRQVEEKAMGDFGGGGSLPSDNFYLGSGGEEKSIFPAGFESGTSANHFRSNPSAFQGDLDAALINSSPDEDMAILDQLLELQQGENDYKKDHDNTETAISKVNDELDEQEKLLGKLRGSLKVYHSMKGKYEHLLSEVSSLEQEKGELAEQLAKVEVDPTRGCSKAIRSKLEKVEESLARARSESRKQQQMYKSAEREAQKARAMERKIDELKLGKANLMRRQKETMAKHRQFTESKTREIQSLKKKEKKQGKNLTKLETECKKHKKALDRRTSYCHKITDKLKQTETHLMRLLAMRKRELEKSNSARIRASDAGNIGMKLGKSSSKKGLGRTSFIHPPSWTVNGSSSANGDTCGGQQFAPKNQEVSSLKFLLENYIMDKIDVAETREKYEATVEEYSELMRDLLAEVKKLNEVKGSGEDGELSNEDEDIAILNHERNIEELELRLELVGVDMEELRGRLSGHLEEENANNNENGGEFLSVQDTATLKVVGDTVAPVARTVILELIGTLTNSELQRRTMEKELKKKDAEISDLGRQNAELQIKITQIAEASQYSSIEDAEGAYKIKTQLDQKERSLLETKEELSLVQKKYQSTAIELAEYQQKFCVADISKDMKKETETALAQLQTYWRLIGVDLDEREKVRVQLESCVEDKCNELLRNATKMERDTREEVDKLNGINESMKRALGHASSKHDDTNASEGKPSKSVSAKVAKAGDKRVSLLKQRADAQETYAEIEPIFIKAKMRLKNIHKGAKDLLTALEKGKDSVSLTLRNFLAANEEEDGILSDDLLNQCEEELRKMRVMKSELLVKSNSAYERAHNLATETHTSSDELFQLTKIYVRKAGNMEWWTDDVCKQVCEFVTMSDMKVPTSSLWGKHLDLITKSVERISKGREEFSCVLKKVVEEAHKHLMSVVEGEDDATEAYTSFHNALFRLPRFSKDYIQACVKEIGMLASAAEVMMQSETEALAVIWDALTMDEGTRSAFWAECADQMKDYKAKQEGTAGMFDKARKSLAEGATEDWMNEALKKATSFEIDLQFNLFRLRIIHQEVEKKRTKQDAKSTIMSLDSEIRIIDAKLAHFEDQASNKQRLVSKKTNSGVLLKEEKFRKRMQSTFISKLNRLRTVLAAWEEREGESFDLKLLSGEVRELLGKGVGGGDDRTAFMHLRTVKSGVFSGTSGKGVKRRSTMVDNAASAAEPRFDSRKIERSNSDGEIDVGKAVSQLSVETGREDSSTTQKMQQATKIAAAVAEATAGIVALNNKVAKGRSKVARRKSRAEGLKAYKLRKAAAAGKGGDKEEEAPGENTKSSGKEEAGSKQKERKSRESVIRPFGNILTPTKENIS